MLDLEGNQQLVNIVIVNLPDTPPTTKHEHMSVDLCEGRKRVLEYAKLPFPRFGKQWFL